MTRMHATDSDVEKLRRTIGRAGFLVAVSLLVVAVVLFSLGYRAASAQLFPLALVVLIAMPVKNVLAVLADEVLRRDWWFGLIAIGVLAELAFSILDWLPR